MGVRFTPDLQEIFCFFRPQNNKDEKSLVTSPNIIHPMVHPIILFTNLNQQFKKLERIYTCGILGNLSNLNYIT